MPGFVQRTGGYAESSGRAGLHFQARWPTLLDMVREAIGAPDQGNVACECTSTSAAAATRRVPPEWWVSKHLVTHMHRRLPLTPPMRMATCLATSPKTCTALRSAMLRAMPMSPSVYTQLAIGMRTHLHLQQVKPCSKRMYIRMLFHLSNHMTMRLAWHMTRPLQRPERTRTGLRITQSDDMRVKQRGSTCGASRLDERFTRPGDTHSVHHCVMDDVIGIAKVGGTHVAADVPMYVARPLVERLPRHVRIPSRPRMNTRMDERIAIRGDCHV